jgi:uncharacterized protein YndB with AHSA1/START domain
MTEAPTTATAIGRELVFRARTEPEQFARWFGPHGTLASTSAS